MAPRWRKVWRDLTKRRGRSILAALAMGAGVFEIGAMLYKYALLQPELTSMYGRTNPASATLFVDRVTDGLIDSVRRVPGVADAEARPVIVARARLGEDEWVPAVLFVVRDFERHRIDRFTPEEGAWPPADGDVLIERSGLTVAKAAIGDRLVLRTAGGEDTELKVAGTVHAPGMAPAWMEHMVPGFVTWNSTLRRDGVESAQIKIVVKDHPLDEGWIREVSDSTQAMLERAGHVVTRIDVPAPGRHPHADQMAAFLFLLLSFGVLSFALSTVLVAGMVHAIMAEQVREIGILKAIGARDRQVTGMYLGQVAILAGLALLIGIPAGLVVGRAYAQFAAGILNADITRVPFPWALLVAEVVVGLLVPMLVALGPVRRAARITVREALAETPGAAPVRVDAWERRIRGLTWIPRPLLLSLRTTLRKRVRLAATLGTLAVGGAVFVSALNVAAAWTRSVDADFSRRRYDLTVTLAERQPRATLAALVASVPGVASAEYWPGANPYLIGASGVPGGLVAMIGQTPGSRLLDLKLVAGRWLGAGDADAAVINRAVQIKNPALEVGDSVRVRIGGRTLAYPIVGVVKELTPMPVVYTTSGAVFAATGVDSSTARSIRVVTERHDDAGQREVARALERALADGGVEVSGMHRMLDQKQGILDHLVIILAILTMASVIVVFVGALALTSMLTLNVVQRTRELGILGAIGATPATLSRHVWYEALLLGAASWVAAMVLAAPITWALETGCGQIFFKAPLDFYLSPGASAAWLGLVLVLASLCSFYPALRAARLPVREALAHV